MKYAKLLMVLMVGLGHVAQAEEHSNPAEFGAALLSGTAAALYQVSNYHVFDPPEPTTSQELNRYVRIGDEMRVRERGLVQLGGWHRIRDEKSVDNVRADLERARAAGTFERLDIHQRPMRIKGRIATGVFAGSLIVAAMPDTETETPSAQDTQLNIEPVEAAE